jgi:hypothetical protein
LPGSEPHAERRADLGQPRPVGAGRRPARDRASRTRAATTALGSAMSELICIEPRLAFALLPPERLERRGNPDACTFIRLIKKTWRPVGRQVFALNC